MRFLLALTFLSASAFGSLTQKFELYGARSGADLKKFQAWGINQVIVDSDSVLALAGEMGFHTVQPNWFHATTPWNDVEARLKNALTVPGLVSVNLMDEPYLNGVEKHPAQYYVELRQKIHTVYPRLPLSLTEYGPSPSWNEERKKIFQAYLPSVDLLRIDPYPVLVKKPLRAVYDWIRLARNLMKERPIPIVTVLQTWTETLASPELPTLEQLRVMAYLALFAESETVSFFDYNAAIWGKVPGFEDGFVALIAELKLVASRFRGYRIHHCIDDFGIFRAHLWKKHSKYVATIDTTSLKIDITKIPLAKSKMR